VSHPVALVLRHSSSYSVSFFFELGDDDDEPEWMVEFAKKNSRRAVAEKRQEFEARLAKIKREEERLKQASTTQDRPRKKQVCIT
jgi:hypothetical protein